MQIVIDIDDMAYKFVQDTAFVEDESTMFEQTNADRQKTLMLFDIIGSIRNGTPLPKGHGRLIDADELKTFSYEVLVDTDNPNRSDGLSACNGIVEEDIDLAPTIIEADKAESEVQD